MSRELDLIIKMLEKVEQKIESITEIAESDGKKIGEICRNGPYARMCGGDSCPTICVGYQQFKKSFGGTVNE